MVDVDVDVVDVDVVDVDVVDVDVDVEPKYSKCCGMDCFGTYFTDVQT